MAARHSEWFAVMSLAAAGVSAAAWGMPWAVLVVLGPMAAVAGVIVGVVAVQQRKRTRLAFVGLVASVLLIIPRIALGLRATI